MAVTTFPQATKDKSTARHLNTPCAPEDVKGNAQESASSVVQDVQNVAAEVSNKAQDWAGNVADKAQQTAAACVDKADHGIAAMGHQMSTLGNSVRASTSPNGAIGSAAAVVADELQAGGHYLEGHGIEAISKDLTDMVRRYPIQSLVVGFGAGCLLGMTLLRSRS